MDVELVQEHIMALTQGHTVSTPIYNMKVPPACTPRRTPAACPMMCVASRSADVCSSVRAFGTCTQKPCQTGYREAVGRDMSLHGQGGDAAVLIIEGIHALNPHYSSKIEPEEKFGIFISPLSSLQLDDLNAVKTTDHRLCRRMCRDYLFRGNNASKVYH